tara:strand:+ start:391 stop:588 length:198 start_codon:yes stop_codon:yes gene_type:complete
MSENNKNVGIIKIILSILSSFIGIQSDKNRVRDFKSNNAKSFIITGLIMTFLLVLILYFSVILIL